LTNAQPGYDGDAPEIVLLRDVAGQGKRASYAVVKPGVWGKRLRRGIIKPHHLEAVAKLESDWHASMLITMSSSAGGGGGTSHNRPSDAKLDAMTRVTRAKEALERQDNGPLMWGAVKHTVIDGYDYRLTRQKLRCNRARVAKLVRLGLDALSRHYGMIT